MPGIFERIRALANTVASAIREKFSGEGRTAKRPFVAVDVRVVPGRGRFAIPNLRQLRYIGKFFSAQEKRLIIAAAALGVLSIIGLSSVFVFRHTTLVPANGGEYSEAMVGQPKYLNPLFASASPIDTDIGSLVFNGLFRYNEAGALTTDLAESYTISDDKKTYTIKLRKDVVWSDGEVFNAGDVIFTFETIQNPAVGSPAFATFQGVTIQRIDDFTVRFTVPQPFAPFLSSLTIGIVPEHIWGLLSADNLKLASYNIEPVGTGPWKFQKLNKDGGGFIGSYSLVPNEKYFGNKPHLATITFKFFPDYGSATEAVRSNTVDALSFVPRETRSRLSSSHIINYDIRLPQYTALFFNTQSDLIKNQSVREVLGGTIDRKTLVTQTLGDDGVVIEGPILPGQLGYAENLEQPFQTIDAANGTFDKLWSRVTPEDYFTSERDKLLATNATSTTGTDRIVLTEEQITQRVRATMPPDQQFFRRDSTKQTVSINITTADTPEYRAVAEYVAATWRKLGLRVTVAYVNPTRLARETIRTHNYDVILYGEIVGNDPDLYPFWHSSQINYPGLNLSQWSSKVADELLEKARSEFSESARGDLYRQFQSELARSTPALFLYSPSHVFAVNKRIHGINLTALSTPESRYQGLAGWYVKEKVSWQK